MLHSFNSSQHLQQVQWGFHLVRQEGCSGKKCCSNSKLYSLETLCWCNGQVSRASFAKLIDAAATMPRAYGWLCTPWCSALQNRLRRMLPGIRCLIPWISNQLYWYMLEIFTRHDSDKDGITEFPVMMNRFLKCKRSTAWLTGDYEALFKKHDPRNDGRLIVDERMSFTKEEVYKKL